MDLLVHSVNSPLDALYSAGKTKAPSTRIRRIFLNPRLFFPPVSKIFPSTRSVFKSNSPVHTHPMVFGFTEEKLEAVHVSGKKATD